MSEDTSEFPVIAVECYAGYRGEQTPRRFRLGEQHVDVAEVADSWLAPEHRYFKVRDPEGHLYILRHAVTPDRWELTWFRRSTRTL